MQNPHRKRTIIVAGILLLLVALDCYLWQIRASEEADVNRRCSRIWTLQERAARKAAEGGSFLTQATVQRWIAEDAQLRLIRAEAQAIVSGERRKTHDR